MWTGKREKIRKGREGMGRLVARRRRGTVGTGFGVGGQGKVGDGLWSFGDVEGDAGVVFGYVLIRVMFGSSHWHQPLPEST